MKYFTLVFLAALGLDSQAVLKAYKNICTPLSLELAFFFFFFWPPFRQRNCLIQAGMPLRERQVVFDSHHRFLIQNGEPALSFCLFQSGSMCPSVENSALTKRGVYFSHMGRLEKYLHGSGHCSSPSLPQSLLAFSQTEVVLCNLFLLSPLVMKEIILYNQR